MDRERRILLTIAYDGTDFHGWQFQEDLRTVEGTLRAALDTALGPLEDLCGASRTDRGVHAWGQCATFTTRSPIPAQKIPQVVNASLPPDVRVRAAREVPSGFHARFDACGKLYRYTFHHTEVENVFLSRYVTPIPRWPDVTAMVKAAADLEGRHDFAGFQASSKQPRTSTVRRLYCVSVVAERPFLHLYVLGSAFLYKMVRNIAGTLLDLGFGRLPAGAARQAIECRDRTLAGQTAPPRGLCLLAVYYDRGELEEAAAVPHAAAEEGAFPAWLKNPSLGAAP